MIRIEHINKSFGSQQVLRDVTLEIPDGQIVGLLGPNGAGKSTLMKILMGLWRPDSGSVSVPERIGYLPENNPLYEDMYVSEYLAFMAGLTSVSPKDGLSGEAGLNSVSEAVNSLIDLVGLTPERHKHIRELSKGLNCSSLMNRPQDSTPTSSSRSVPSSRVFPNFLPPGEGRGGAARLSSSPPISCRRCARCATG